MERRRTAEMSPAATYTAGAGDAAASKNLGSDTMLKRESHLSCVLAAGWSGVSCVCGSSLRETTCCCSL